MRKVDEHNNYERVDKNRFSIVSTLFYIVNREITKPASTMNIALIDKCVEFVPQFDSRFCVSEEQKQSVKNAALAEYRKNHCNDSTETKKKPQRISKRVKVIIIAAIISILITGIAVYAFTDVFSLFFDDPREKLEWKNGESRRIDNYEMTISDAVEKYDSIDELINSVSYDFICPIELPKEYRITSILYKPLETDPTVFINYSCVDRQIIFQVLLDRESYNIEELDHFNYEKIKTQNNNTFFLMKGDEYYQGVAKIGYNVYFVCSENKADIIQFIKNVKEL